MALTIPAPVHAELASPLLGQKLPNFGLPDEKGKARWIDDLRAGRPLVLSFFRTDCAPCKAELPHLQALHAKYADRLAVVLILEDKEGHQVFEPFRVRHGITFPLLHDSRGLVCRSTLRVQALPAVFIVAADGTVKDIRSGFDAKQPLDFERAVAELTGLQ